MRIVLGDDLTSVATPVTPTESCHTPWVRLFMSVARGRAPSEGVRDHAHLGAQGVAGVAGGGVVAAGGGAVVGRRVIAIEKAMASLKVLITDRAAEAGAWRARGARWAEEDLARRSGTSTGRAEDALATAKRAKKHPAMSPTLQDGKLSSEQVSGGSPSAAEANPTARTGPAASEPMPGPCPWPEAAATPVVG